MSPSSRWVNGVGAAPHLLVIGGASLDVLHVGGAPVTSAGGAGLYTALAAMRSGARPTMLAPLPDPMPKVLVPARRLLDWRGPVVAPENLPRFEIAYDAAGRVVRFDRFMGAEPEMRPELLDGLDALPPLAFCVPFLDAELQLAFVEEVIRRGLLAAANTYSCAAEREPDTVRRTAATADVFFCNETEARSVFGSVEAAAGRPGQLRFVTLGERGALVFQGDHRTHVPAGAVNVVDPTGAGDTFCGTVLAHLVRGLHPVEAARHGVAAAGHMVGGIGPAMLLDPSEAAAPPPDDRARVDPARVAAVASVVAGLDEAAPFPFTGEGLPDPDEPGALDFFFSATLQQFGFWDRADGHYGAPTYATVGGTRHKGSDYLWAAYLRWLRDDPGGLTPAGQEAVTPADYAPRLADDTGDVPLPALDLHAALAKDYGRTMRTQGWDPARLVETVCRTARPLEAALRLLDHVGGYREDPLRKKSALLALILHQRPERWLPEPAGDDGPPIVDYHVQRGCLRTGMVRVDDDLRERLEGRFLLEEADEEAVRRASYSAVEQLAAASGRPMGAVDWFLFEMRHRCPETSEPECSRCPARPACARDTALFQPVRRTTFY